MRRLFAGLTWCMLLCVGVWETMAHSTIAGGAQATISAQSATIAPSSMTSSRSTQGAFGKLSPGGQKIATALCEGQTGGCPPPRSSTQSTSSSIQPGKPPTLTRDQIASMKQHTGWGRVFEEMQMNGQIPPSVKNLGELVSHRYQGHSGAAGPTVITTASGKSLVVGNQGSGFGKGHFERDSSASSRSGAHSELGGGHSTASSKGGGRSK